MIVLLVTVESMTPDFKQECAFCLYQMLNPNVFSAWSQASHQHMDYSGFKDSVESRLFIREELVFDYLRRTRQRLPSQGYWR